MNDTNETSVNEAVELSNEDLEQYYQTKFGAGIPDLTFGISPPGVSKALADFLTNEGAIPEGRDITGIITNVQFSGENGTLPVAVYLTPEEIPEVLN
jgi:hypothetical protein